ncbi:MAG: hypothetical protein OIN89_04170 [Candidatus Methanoperedens sp.]|jgi:dolichol kinase|nr:hypothetical protein [Candidatus Methanoperedens sp.]PKL53992.1 MAG: hypothetical protein CVV36_04095 [Candidatus Methanoperedenaceae archaeon HGW-Methanoperedenaceae-1]
MFELLLHELRRKAIHLAGSLIPAVYYFIDRETAVVLLSVINAVLLLVEWLRLKGKLSLPGILLRPHEKKQVAAYIYFQLAALLAIFIFDKTIAITALFMLAFGDTASGIAGAVMKGGNVRHNSGKWIKPFPIMAVMFAACIIVGIIVSNIPLAPDMKNLPPAVYIAGALGAAIGDAVNLRFFGKTVDDNLLIPLMAGIFMVIGNLA